MKFISSLSSWIKIQWEDYPTQITGSLALLAAYIIFLSSGIPNRTIILWALLIAVGLVDLILIYVSKKITVSQWLYKLCPNNKLDDIIKVASVALVWWLLGPLMAAAYTFGLLAEHFSKDD